MPAATTVGEIAASISPRLAQAAYAGMVNDRIVDLTHPLQEDAKVRILTNKDPEALTVYRHSTAHLLAAAVTQLFPEVQCGIGPPTDEGFFYDFVVEKPFVPEDLEAIEKRMKEIAGGRFRLRAADVAARGGDRVLPRSRRAAQGAAHRGEDGRPDGRLRLHDQGPRYCSSISAWARTCRRAAG